MRLEALTSCFMPFDQFRKEPKEMSVLSILFILEKNGTAELPSDPGPNRQYPIQQEADFLFPMPRRNVGEKL